jgi:DNA-binding HxlR family transcriptional regulator
MRQIHYNQELAIKLGTMQAILLDYFQYLHIINSKDPERCQDGGVWFYMSYRGFHEMFPEWDSKRINTALQNLFDLGFILKGCYETRSYSRKTWWSLSEKGLELFGPLEKEKDFISEQIPEKKKTTKRVAPKTRLKVEPKWEPFLDFIEGEFAIMYPAHKNKALTIKTGYEFAEDPINYMMTAEEISELITKIKSHYQKYCAKHGTYAVGPKRYLEDRKWTEEVNIFNKNTGAVQEDHKGQSGIEILKAKIKNKVSL